MASRGIEVHGEVVSADASGGVAFTFYMAGADATSRSIGTDETLHITDIDVVSESGGDAGIFTVTDANGKRVWKGNLAANGGVARSYETPHICPAGVTPKLIADAGNVVGIIHGFIASA